MLVRFFDCIAPYNDSMLRAINFAHLVLLRAIEKKWRLVVRHLSPFGIANLLGYCDSNQSQISVNVRCDLPDTPLRTAHLKAWIPYPREWRLT